MWIYYKYDCSPSLRTDVEKVKLSSVGGEHKHGLLPDVEMEKLEVNLIISTYYTSKIRFLPSLINEMFCHYVRDAVKRKAWSISTHTYSL